MRKMFDTETISETGSINFEKRFEARRRAMQLSQRDLANEVGVSVNTFKAMKLAACRVASIF